VFLYFSAHPGRLPALHRTDCPRRRELRDERVQTQIEWRPGEKETFPVPIHLEVEDRPGVLASVLDVFQKWNVNLSHVEARTHGGRGEIVLVAQVTDAGLLTRILRQLQNLSRVLAVRRVGLDRVPEALMEVTE
jgi:(p)ppGpp synthase/HD superfamily hydrolase